MFLTASRPILIFGLSFLAYAVSSTDVLGQGSVNFSNIRSPLKFHGEPVGSNSGFFAQLQTADGTNIGEPAPFLINGIFAGGDRMIQGQATGTEVVLQVAVTDEQSQVIVTSEPFAVILGDHENPADLDGLSSFDISRGPGRIYAWTMPYVSFGFDKVICERVGGGPLPAAVVEADECFCAGLPHPTDPNRKPAPCNQGTDERITYSLKSNGNLLELRWPVGKSLYRSSVLAREQGQFVSGTRTENGFQVRNFATTESHYFFWLQ